ncbi:hypothetical protein EV361DRAFT_908160 [Lentinula raphanica]|nr:hypothetical protein EV361DRAFT_908160 [Lentinula raphanica]
MNAYQFYKQQEERMNISDDDSDEVYMARMTRGNQEPGDQEKKKAAMNDATHIPCASPPRGSKRKTDKATPLRSSPRIKRSKLLTMSTNPIQAGMQCAASNANIDSSEEAPTTRSSPDSKNEHVQRGIDSVAQVKAEPTILIDEPARSSNFTGLASKSFSRASNLSSSPIEASDTFYIPSEPNDKSPTRNKSMLEIILEAKNSSRRRGAKKPVPLAHLQINPKPQSHPADETSVIDGYTSSEPPTSPVPTSPVRSSSFSIPEDSSPVKFAKPLAPAPKAGVTSMPNMATKSSKTKAKGKGKEKEKPRPTPYEFACQVQNTPINKTGRVQFLEGSRIFYCGTDINSKLSGDTTQERLKIILRHGGVVIPKYEPEQITHIVVDKVLGQNSFLRATGLPKISEIPDHIPILTWQWIVDLIDNNPFPRKGKTIKIRQVSTLFEYGAYSNRLPPVSAVSTVTKVHQPKGAAKQEGDNGDFSRISEFSTNDIQPDAVADGVDSRSNLEAQPKRKTLTKGASTRVPLDFQPVKTESVDPLLEFYLQEKENGHNGSDSVTDDSDPEPDHQEADAKSKTDWLCKEPNRNAKPCPNEDIIKKLEELQELHRVKPTEDDRWRVFSYSKSIRALRAHPKRIKSLEDAQKIKGVGAKTAQKIMEIIETGDLQRITYERTEDVQVVSVFTKIYGVGIQTATMWYARGCRTIEDLCNSVGDVTLNEGQKIGIQFYDDLNSRMPREEAKAIFDLIKPIALRIDPKLFVEIMGSYRRGKADCGDIDILITRCPDDGQTHEGVLHELLERLHTAGILTEDLALPDYSKPLEAVYHGICRLPNVPGARRRRIDFLTVPWNCKGGALLYYTGDDMFNRSMRLLANKMGYSLNQRGLYAGVVRDPRNRTVKLNTGNLIASETEEQIFKKLGVPWREPHERVTYYQDIVKAEEEKRKRRMQLK